MKIKLLNIVLLVALVMFNSNSGIAAPIYHEARITALLNDAKNYSGCMLRIEPSHTNNSCIRKDFITLDCQGLGVNSRSDASILLDAATMAFVLEKPVRLRITDNVINGFCVADYVRIDLE
jgi:hypothetical protein